MTYLPRRARVPHPPNKFRHHLKYARNPASMVARTPPPLRFLPPPPPHPSRNIYLNSSHVTDNTTVSGGGFLTLGVALAIVDAFAKFKESGFIQKPIT